MDQTELPRKFLRGSNYETPINTARRLLQKHPDPDFQYNLVAVAYRGSNLIEYGFNRPKTHPKLREVAERYNIQKMYDHSDSEWIPAHHHAEIGCMKNVSSGVECVVIVGISTSDDSLLTSKPCNPCMKMLEECGVGEVVYYDGEKFVKERL